MDLHKDAKERFNEIALNIRENLEPRPQQPPKRAPGFQPDIHISGHISSQDVVGEVDFWHRDATGERIERIVTVGNRRLVVGGEAYKELRRLCSSISSALRRSAAVSPDRIENEVVKWIRDNLAGGVPEGTMLEQVLPALEEAVADHVLWIPISRLHIQVPIKVGPTLLRQLDWQSFERWKTKAEAKATDAFETDSIDQLFRRLSTKLKGLAVAVTTVHGDIDSARDVALQRTADATAILRMFHPAALIPQVQSYCTILGREGVEGHTCITIAGGEVVGMFEGNDDSAPNSWSLDAAKIGEMQRVGFAALVTLYEKPKKSALESSVLGAIFLYSRMTTFTDPSDKIVYILTSLERTFLKNQTEPVQQNLGERVAFLVGKNLEHRKAILKSVRSAYDLRSRFLHHGKKAEDLDQLSELMSIAWNALLAVVDQCKSYSSKEALLGALDERKMQ